MPVGPNVGEVEAGESTNLRTLFPSHKIKKLPGGGGAAIGSQRQVDLRV